MLLDNHLNPGQVFLSRLLILIINSSEVLNQLSIFSVLVHPPTLKAQAIKWVGPTTEMSGPLNNSTTSLLRCWRWLIMNIPQALLNIYLSHMAGSSFLFMTSSSGFKQFLVSCFPPPFFLCDTQFYSETIHFTILLYFLWVNNF